MNLGRPGHLSTVAVDNRAGGPPMASVHAAGAGLTKGEASALGQPRWAAEERAVPQLMASGQGLPFEAAGEAVEAAHALSRLRAARLARLSDEVAAHAARTAAALRAGALQDQAQAQIDLTRDLLRQMGQALDRAAEAWHSPGSAHRQVIERRVTPCRDRVQELIEVLRASREPGGPAGPDWRQRATEALRRAAPAALALAPRSAPDSAHPQAERAAASVF